MKPEINPNILRFIRDFDDVEINYIIEVEGDGCPSGLRECYPYLSREEFETERNDLIERPDAPPFKTYTTVYLHYSHETGNVGRVAIADCIVYEDAALVAEGLKLLIETAKNIEINAGEGA